MDALILSCGTGGGHNSAGLAIKNELRARGHGTVMLDPYTLVSDSLSVAVGNIYIKTVQRKPKAFGVVYAAGELVRHIPAKSPVYYANVRVAAKLAQYLNEHPVDVVITSHLFPAEMLTCLKRRGVKLPLTVFVATDYTCIPFTEETECDFYIIPGTEHMAEFEKRGISKSKLLPFGIPVAGRFYRKTGKDRARELLGLDKNKKYILVTGGSIGAGDLPKVTKILVQYRREQDTDTEVIVVCGNNERLYKKLSERYPDEILLIGQTKQMPLYMKACDIFISKPGGLSSTEAAVAGTPFIQITPIPGCEGHNMRYFTKKGMAAGVKRPNRELMPAIRTLCNQEAVQKMQSAQRKWIPERALFTICDWIEEKTFVT